MESPAALHQVLDVEPRTAIPHAFPEERARVLRILLKWQASLVPMAVPPAELRAARSRAAA